MKILGIETSCDETAAAVLEVKNGRFNLLSNIVSSQVKIHAKYGGIVPEVAARKQMEMVLPIIQGALVDAKLKSKKIKISRRNNTAPGRTWSQQIDAIAVTQGPGLITSLTVGVETAKTLSSILNKPLIPVNHLIGHLLANYLKNNKIKYPAIGLIVSGGHTMLVLLTSPNPSLKRRGIKIIGQTLDDAAGECFDKVAKILNLGYPGGPIISKLAKKGNPTAYNFPRPMISQDNLDFSFSGLKTSVLYAHKKSRNQKIKKSKKYISDMCASFQQAVIDVLISKTLQAIKKYSTSSLDKKPKSFLLGGGVAANPELRKQLQNKINAQFPKIKIFIPELKFTGDNAAMIAVAGYFQMQKNKKSKNQKK